MHIKVDENGNILDKNYSIFKLKSENPNVSFPARFTEELLNSFNVYTVIVKPHAEYDERTQRPEAASEPIKGEDGKWYLETHIVDLSEEEVQIIYNNKAFLSEGERTARLEFTDWWALSDTPDMTPEQTAYRQALRDITTHPNWPWLEESDWPVKPE